MAPQECGARRARTLVEKCAHKPEKKESEFRVLQDLPLAVAGPFVYITQTKNFLNTCDGLEKDSITLPISLFGLNIH